MEGVVVGGRRIKCIKLADDIVLLAEEWKLIGNMLLELNDSCKQYGMKCKQDEDHSYRKKNKEDQQALLIKVCDGGGCDSGVSDNNNNDDDTDYDDAEEEKEEEGEEEEEEEEEEGENDDFLSRFRFPKELNKTIIILIISRVGSCDPLRGRANTLEELRQRITNVAALVTPQMPQNTWREVEYRLDVCRTTQGAHIERNRIVGSACDPYYKLTEDRSLRAQSSEPPMRGLSLQEAVTNSWSILSCCRVQATPALDSLDAKATYECEPWVQRRKITFFVALSNE
ncbi:hypothetical protein ANN_03044 [Periplaneta americana]|uniref:Uncharacterized protein n=1 Tax=Periplaneta americana TaxID=6978 RepID=A0ABQ8U2R2_PERAM|nr:hypothetical protein ANN_03044 [Periplaneta americana]